jgi:hypothetical protein
MGPRGNPPNLRSTLSGVQGCDMKGADAGAAAAPRSADEQDEVINSVHELRKRSKSYTGPCSSTDPTADGELTQLTAQRHNSHNSLCVPRRRGTKVVADTEGGSSVAMAQLLHGQPVGGSAGPAHLHAQGRSHSNVLSTAAVSSSPPESLGSEVPSSGKSSGSGTDRVTDTGESQGHPPAAPLPAHSADTSRPATGTSHSTRLSQHSMLQVLCNIGAGYGCGRGCEGGGRGPQVWGNWLIVGSREADSLVSCICTKREGWASDSQKAASNRCAS